MNAIQKSNVMGKVIAVINNAGSIGKTALTAQMIYPRLINPRIFKVETINKGITIPGEIFIAGEDYIDLANAITGIENDENIVIDFGASTITEIHRQLRAMPGTEEAIDVWLVPTIAENKVQADTAATIDALIGFGVDPARIFVLPNKIRRPSKIQADFACLREKVLGDGARFADTYVLESDGIKLADRTMDVILERTTDDCKTEISSLPNGDLRRSELTQEVAVIRLCTGMSKNFNSAFNEMMAGV